MENYELDVMWFDSVNKAVCSELIRKVYLLLVEEALRYEKVGGVWTY